MKKLIAILLIIATLIVSSVIAAGCSNDSDDEGSVTTTSPLPDESGGTMDADASFVYTVYKTYAEVSAYMATGSMVYVPSQINGIPVKSIGSEAFYGNTNITKVVLPDSVVNIGMKAFGKCTNLTEI